ncbi:MAG: T9SS type A sorting domain-containing protein, partial [Bacteroidota bacterium]
LEELVVLGDEPENLENILQIHSDKIQIINSSNESFDLTIFDRQGRNLLNTQLDNSIKESTVNFSFEKGSIYLLVLRSKSKILTRKFILTN